MLNTLLILILVYNVAYILVVIRLKLNHENVYVELGSPAVIPVSLRKFSKNFCKFLQFFMEICENLRSENFSEIFAF